jgi:hypothetical protein
VTRLYHWRLYGRLPNDGFEGVLPLGQRWVFWSDALGSTVQFRIGDDEGELTLPDTRSEAPSGRGPMGYLDPPPWLSTGDADWGQVVSTPTRLSLVGALGLRVQLTWYSVEQPTREQLEGNASHLATGLFPWMRQLRAWLSAIVGADLTTESPEDLPGGIPDGVSLRPVGSNEWTLKQERNTSLGYSTARAISLANWRRGVRLVSEGAELPVEHALLNGARHALEQRNMRLCAIEAGAAAETALSGAIRSKIEADCADLSELHRKTLGQLPTLATTYSVTCPERSEFKKLLDPRNDAVHGKRPLSYPEVREAIRVEPAPISWTPPM